MSTFEAFHAGLLNPATATPKGLTDAADQHAGKRYDVYRNNVTVSLIDAMKSAFPLVAKLLGTENFTRVSSTYVRAHPPTSPVMMFYGAEFPEFLDRFDPLSQIGYLPDAARLDLAMRQSYHAADAPSFDPMPLGVLSSDQLMEATLTLAPATRIVQSRWPLFDIWHVNQDSSAPKPKNISQDVIITRPEFDPVPHALPAGAAIWLNALNTGISFGAAVDQAATAVLDFDLTASLTAALGTQAFAAISHKDLP